MATTTIACPACRKKFKAKEELRGKKIRCPFCTAPFVVPHVDEPIKIKVGGPREAEDEGEADPYTVVTPDLTPRCPHCAKEMASDTAVVCLYCGYNTLLRSHGKTERVIAHTFGECLLYLLPGILSCVLILGQIVFVLFYCLILPHIAAGTWLEYADHESMRLWTTIFALFSMWPIGLFAFHRLVLHPTPPDKVKE